jgi:hypothetical protein
MIGDVNQLNSALLDVSLAGNVDPLTFLETAGREAMDLFLGCG